MKYDDCSDRLLLKHDQLDEPPETKDKYDKELAHIIEVATPEEANLIASKCSDGMHAPVLDFDYPIQVYPSSQMGHYHLYLGKKIPWNSYKKVLLSLGNAGVVEKGYADASMNKGYSAVRPVGTVKPNAPTGVEVLIENGQLKQENYKLRVERDYLLTLLKDYVDPQSTDTNAI